MGWHAAKHCKTVFPTIRAKFRHYFVAHFVDLYAVFSPFPYGIVVVMFEIRAGAKQNTHWTLHFEEHLLIFFDKWWHHTLQNQNPDLSEGGIHTTMWGLDLAFGSSLKCSGKTAEGHGGPHGRHASSSCKNGWFITTPTWGKCKGWRSDKKVELSWACRPAGGPFRAQAERNDIYAKYVQHG